MEWRGGLSGNVAEEAFCLKSAPASADNHQLLILRKTYKMKRYKRAINSEYVN